MRLGASPSILWSSRRPTCCFYGGFSVCSWYLCCHHCFNIESALAGSNSQWRPGWPGSHRDWLALHPTPTPHPNPCWVYWHVLPHLVILFSFIGTHNFLFAIQIVDLMFNIPIEICISNSLVFKALWQLNSPVSCSPKSFALLLKSSALHLGLGFLTVGVKNAALYRLLQLGNSPWFSFIRSQVGRGPPLHWLSSSS